MDQPQVPGAYITQDKFRGHFIFPDAIKPANVGLYIAIIDLEATVIVEDDLWHAIHMDGAVDMMSQDKVYILY